MDNVDIRWFKSVALWFRCIYIIAKVPVRYIHNSKSSYQSLPACVREIRMASKVKKNIDMAPNSLCKILLTNLNSLRTISNDQPVAALTNQTDTDQFVPWHTRVFRETFLAGSWCTTLLFKNHPP